MNTSGLKQHGYALFGAKAGYDIDENLSVTVQADNLTNRRYASSYVTRYQATAAQPTFTSGNGRSASASIVYRF